ncbi:hypothetical protein L2E82_09848 [Cichorium intybus]|uniref:Uncharacterized protein n=1 Tax=Cichorium intybus TaxID=13427 RepID=A0ACB9G9D3_CICIN|nr:hypothetical protein L2E82_09848 [Cichorium intybus]
MSSISIIYFHVTEGSVLSKYSGGLKLKNSLATCHSSMSRCSSVLSLALFLPFIPFKNKIVIFRRTMRNEAKNRESQVESFTRDYEPMLQKRSMKKARIRAKSTNADRGIEASACLGLFKGVMELESFPLPTL